MSGLLCIPKLSMHAYNTSNSQERMGYTCWYDNRAEDLTKEVQVALQLGSELIGVSVTVFRA